MFQVKYIQIYSTYYEKQAKTLRSSQRGIEDDEESTSIRKKLHQGRDGSVLGSSAWLSILDDETERSHIWRWPGEVEWKMLQHLKEIPTFGIVVWVSQKLKAKLLILRVNHKKNGIN